MSKFIAPVSSVAPTLFFNAETPKKTKKSADADNTAIEKADVIARVSGKLKIVGTKAKPESVTIAWEDEEQREYIVLATANVIVQTGDNVVAGQALTSGPKNPQQILRIQGRDNVITVNAIIFFNHTNCRSRL